MPKYISQWIKPAGTSSHSNWIHGSGHITITVNISTGITDVYKQNVRGNWITGQIGKFHARKFYNFT